MRSNQFGFDINWARGMSVAVDACTNLANSSWIPLATNILTDSAVRFRRPPVDELSISFLPLAMAVKRGSGNPQPAERNDNTGAAEFSRRVPALQTGQGPEAAIQSTGAFLSL